MRSGARAFGRRNGDRSGREMDISEFALARVCAGIRSLHARDL